MAQEAQQRILELDAIRSGYQQIMHAIMADTFFNGFMKALVGKKALGNASR